MQRTGRKRQPAASGHALALVRWEENSRRWNSGSDPEMRSRVRDLQDLIGNRGTLWIVTSRKQRGGTRYSLAFKFGECQKADAPNGRFGKFAVIGDPSASRVFATNDASLLLLGLRFAPPNAIDDPIDRLKGIGLRLQTPRALSQADVRLLEAFTKGIARWSIFVSYEHHDARVADRLLIELERRGLNTFRDKTGLRPGEAWWPAIRAAIAGSKVVVVVVGKSTASSTWTRREIDYARKRGKVVIPVLVNSSSITTLGDLGLGDVHAELYAWGERASLLERVEQAARS